MSEGTMNYRVRPESLTGHYGFGDATGDCLQRYYCALARNWRCAARGFGPALRDILHKEIAAVLHPSRGHRRVHAAARKASGSRRVLF
jgi:hypothetical protein